MRISILLFLLISACSTNNINQEQEEHQKILDDVISQTIGPVFSTHKDKIVGVYWKGKIHDGYFRKKFVEIKSDSFQLVKNIDKDSFAEFKRSLQDTLKIKFHKGDKIGGLLFLKELPKYDSTNSYFIVVASASKPVIRGINALIYIEFTDIFYHDGDGLICELEFKDNKWNVERVTTAWYMRMDTLRMGVFN